MKKLFQISCLILLAGCFSAKSQNSLIWQKVLSATNGWATTVNYGNSKYIASTTSGNSSLGSRLFVSDNSATAWTQASCTQPEQSLPVIVYGGGLFLNVGSTNQNNTNRYIASTSFNGTNFSNPTYLNLSTLTAASYVNGLFFVSGTALNSTSTLLTSPDGASWTALTIGNTVSAIAYGNGHYVAVGGNLFTSQDGVAWVNQGNGHGLYSVAFGNGVFVAIDGLGECAWSLDGITWSVGFLIPTSQGTPHAVAFGNNQFVVAGESAAGGEIFTSTTGTNNWSQAYAGSEGSGFYGLAYGSGCFVAVGPAGILRGSLPVSTNLPMITLQPLSQQVPEGTNVTFTTLVNGGGPLGFQWQFNSVSIPKANSSVLNLTNVSPGASGNYTLIITNTYGSVTSSIAFLGVTTLAINNQPTNQLVTPGSNTFFSVTASGAVSISYAWQFNGTNLPGANSSTLYLTNVNTLLAGNYQALVSCPFGSVTSSTATLVLAAPPLLSVQTSNLVGTLGTNLTIGVIASGPGPFTYQWRHNGTNIPNILTIAGGNPSSWLGDGGLATNAGMSVASVYADSKGNVYVIDDNNDNIIRKIDTNGIINTIAGKGGYGFSGDTGPATNALMAAPNSISVDSIGNIFIADTENNRIRKIDTNGVINTVTASGYSVYLSGPLAVRPDNFGNLFVADTGHNRIVEVDKNGGFNVICGTFSAGFTGDGGPATNALISKPVDLALDNYGNIFFADQGNHRVRKISSNGIISTVAGNGTLNVTAANVIATNTGVYPYSVAVDTMGNLFIYDTGFCVRKVSTNGVISIVAGNLSGNSNNGHTGDGGPATNATLNAGYSLVDNYPYWGSVAIDSNGSLIIGDYDRVRKVSLNGIISTIAGGSVGDNLVATNANLNSPVGICLDRLGNILIADQYNNRIRKVDTNHVITTIAGNGSKGFSGDGGSAVSASLNNPMDVSVDNVGNVLIADYGNNRIRMVGTNGIIKTLAGGGAYGPTVNGVAATNTILYLPIAVANDNYGNWYYADADYVLIRKIGTNGIINTIAGGGKSGDSGYATNTAFQGLTDFSADAFANIYTTSRYDYAADKVTPDGLIKRIAGTGTQGFSGDNGPATNALLSGVNGVAVDIYGNVFIADSARVREVDTNGLIKTLAGNGISGNDGDGGSAINAKCQPQRVATDALGNLYFSDSYHNVIREITQPNVGPQLILRGISTGDLGNYDVLVSNAYGTTTSAVVTVSLDVSVAEILKITNLAVGRFQIGIVGNIGRAFNLQGSYDLFHWANLAAYTNTTGTLMVTNQKQSLYKSYFYRTIETQPSASGSSAPNLSGFTRLAGGRNRLQVNSFPGAVWQLQGSPDLKYWGSYSFFTNFTANRVITNFPFGQFPQYFYRTIQP